MRGINTVCVALFGLLLPIGCAKQKEFRTPVADAHPTAALLNKAQTYLPENLYTPLSDSNIEQDFKRLIAKGAIVDTVDGDSNSALLLLAQTADFRYFKKVTSLSQILLEKNANVNRKNARQFTALHVASSKGNKPLVELLLAHGADVNAVDNSRYTPVVYAVMGNFVEIVEILARKGADLTWKEPSDGMSLLSIAEQRGNTKTADYLKHSIKPK